ncbi:unnamed protein product, partial [Iphiclides podalirius]
MSYTLEDKVILITGAATGIGSWVVKMAVEEGAKDDLYYSRTGVRFLTICFGPTKTPLMTKEKMGSFDANVEAALVDSLNVVKFQSPEFAARGLVNAYKNGSSGSVWIIAGEKPNVDVTDLYNRGYDVYNDHIYN